VYLVSLQMDIYISNLPDLKSKLNDSSDDSYTYRGINAIQDGDMTKSCSGFGQPRECYALILPLTSVPRSVGQSRYTYWAENHPIEVYRFDYLSSYKMIQSGLATLGSKYRPLDIRAVTMKDHKSPALSIPATAVITGAFLSGTQPYYSAPIISLPLTLFTGAMLSICLLSIPILLDTNTNANHLIVQWVRLYHYGHLLLPSLSVATCSTYLYTAISKRTSPKLSSSKSWVAYLGAGAATVAIIPFTLAVMVPTNDKLFQLNENIEVAEGQAVATLESVQMLVRTWAKMHFARSLFPLFGAIIGAYGLLDEFATQ
jgi:hypothetical protein